MTKKKKKNPKYIFIVGGVMSSVGKGIATASMGALLQSRGFSATALKIDPYVNVDAGTMNPTEHGEVFVLSDGMECDQDMGNYERYLNKNFTKENYMTTGSIYLSVINKERNLEYNGRCVHVVPDIPLEVLKNIDKAIKKDKADIALVEIGGTIGDYQNVLFLESYRILKFLKPEDTILVLVTYVPALSVGGNELKTKPTQHAVRNLNAVGVHPDIVIARATVPIDQKRKEKLEYMVGLEKGSVISAPDVNNIYDVPLNFERDGLTAKVLKKLNLKSRRSDISFWKNLASKVSKLEEKVHIGIVGKYYGTGEFILTDSYISVIEAIKHASYARNLKPEIEWLNAEDYDEKQNKDAKKNLSNLKKFNGIIVPGGFGSRGVEGKINAIEFCRKNKIPYFGLCYGMQMAVVEFARNVAGLKNANTTEVDDKTAKPVIDIMPEQKMHMKQKNYGATMRLGSYPCVIKPKTIAQSAYKETLISERHRHRYEVNPEYIENLEKAGLIFSGTSPNGVLMEIAELPKNIHPFFVGTQFHPELQSKPMNPHPLFVEFIKSARDKK